MEKQLQEALRGGQTNNPYNHLDPYCNGELQGYIRTRLTNKFEKELQGDSRWIEEPELPGDSRWLEEPELPTTSKWDKTYKQQEILGKLNNSREQLELELELELDSATQHTASPPSELSSTSNESNEIEAKNHDKTPKRKSPVSVAAQGSYDEMKSSLKQIKSVKKITGDETVNPSSSKMLKN
jgi:hypothetical protein